MVDGRYVADEASTRIATLAQQYLKFMGRDSSGWDALYRDPGDGRYWELFYPHSEMQGGGPPEMRCIPESEAMQKYPAAF